MARRKYNLSGRGYSMTKFSKAESVKHYLNHQKDIEEKTFYVRGKELIPKDYIRWDRVAEWRVTPDAKTISSRFWTISILEDGVQIGGSIKRSCLTKKALKELGVPDDKLFISFLSDDALVFPLD